MRIQNLQHAGDLQIHRLDHPVIEVPRSPIEMAEIAAAQAIGFCPVARCLPRASAAH